jgi:hypothetical protein
MLSSPLVHVDSALSNLSVAYDNPDFVFVKEVFPVVPSDKQSDIFFKFSKQQFRTFSDSKRPGQLVNELPLDLDQRGFFFCDGHALDSTEPDEISANADPSADLDIETTLKVTEAVRLNEENNGAGAISTTNISQNTTLSGTSQWSDFVNSDPFLAIDQKKTTIRQSTGKIPNKLIMSEYTFLTLRNHPKLIDRVKYTGTGLRNPLSPEELAQAFQVKKVVVAGALKQANPEGEADSLSYIWAKNVLLAYVEDRPSKRSVSLGYTFVWMVTVSPQGRMTGDLTSNTGGFLVRRYRQENRRSDVIGVEYYYDQRFIDANCGYLFVNAVV